MTQASRDEIVSELNVLLEAERAGARVGAALVAQDKVGDFYVRAMAIGGLEARLAFTNRGQGWVVRKLRELIPRVDEPGLHDTLQSMLDAHVVNIDAANEVLEAKGAPTR